MENNEAEMSKTWFVDELIQIGEIAGRNGQILGDIYIPDGQFNEMKELHLTCREDGAFELSIHGANSLYILPLSRKDNKSNELPPGITGKINLSEKPHLAYLDPHLEYEMGMGMRYGATKHGWNNHRKLQAEAAQHILDSLKRHLNAYLRGEQIDSESNVHHLACLMNNANFLYRLDRLYGYEAVLQNVYGEIK